MRRIVVLGTGGTIASRGSAEANAVATSSISDLLAPLAPDCELDARDVMTIGSYNIGFAEMRRIAEAATAAAAEPGVDGVVVTHGTDTMEESAYLTDLLAGAGIDGADSDCAPIVFTGAQFAADTIAPDGGRNIADAIAFAASPELRGIGAGIAFGGDLVAARGTRKAHTTAPSPFEGGVLIARRRGGDVALHARPARPGPPLAIGEAFDTLVVDAVIAAPGIDPALFEIAAARSKAVVVVGTGVGNAGPGFAQAVAAATEAGTPVVLATRVAFGPVTPVYGGGGGVDIVRAGATAAAELGHAQARILAAALLADPAGAPTTVADFTARFLRHAG